MKLLPFMNWLGEAKNPTTIRADLIAGITVALVLIPQSMAYAQLAGLPPYYGLYISFMPVIIAALWGSSKQLATGPVAVVSLLTASAIIPLVGDPGAMTEAQMISIYAPLAILLAFLVGTFQLFLGVFKLGVIVNFLSHPVIVGFTNAAAMIIGLSQLNKIFGVSKERSESFVNDIWGVIQQVPDHTHIPTFLFGASAILILWGFKKYLPKIPGVLVAVAGTIVVSWMVGYEAMRPGAVVGTIPEGLPSFTMPTFDLDMMGTLITSAIVISLVGFMEAISIAKAMAAKTKDRIDPNQELIGQGLGNITGSFFQSYPASGSFSRSAVNLGAGAKTGMSSVFTGVIVVITLLFLTPLLYHLPKAVLAAVIIMAVIGLINFKAVIHAWHASKHDGIASIVTFVATLGFAPHLDKGIMVGAGLAILLYLYRTISPRVAQLGRFEDGTLRDLRVYPELPTDERIILIRFDGSLYFANVAYFEDTILAAVADKPSARYVLVVGDGINEMDASGEEVLRHLIERLRGNGIFMVVSGLKRQVLDVMRHTGLYEILGSGNIYATEDQALSAIYDQINPYGDEGNFCPLMPEKA
ncbi:SulP family inorganic anion transporter [Candidatus Reidiella endopervernicosa]|nr:SulP family inorganic anion transporter [Candidatus Reidiella endopervernicosa]